MAISFSKDYFPSLMNIDSCNFIFCLKVSRSRPSKASASGPEELVPELLPSPNAIILKLLILSIVSCANFVIVPLIVGILVADVTLGVSLLGSSILRMKYFFYQVRVVF